MGLTKRSEKDTGVVVSWPSEGPVLVSFLYSTKALTRFDAQTFLPQPGDRYVRLP